MTVRFSGHETFPCRYAWLPKAYRAIRKDPKLLADDDAAMVEMGIGKNMVRAARFWVQAMGVSVQNNDGVHQLTAFGKALLGPRGHDPFLEDVRTLWLLHWQLCSHVEHPLFAWDYMLNRWPQSEFTRSAAVQAFRDEARREERVLSDVTLEQHFDVFLHSYVPTRSRRVDLDQDTLDCPLVELGLITRSGERRDDGGIRREPIYAFRREQKTAVTSGLFAYCLCLFWEARHAAEKTLTYREVSFGRGSPGQVFKLPEEDVRARLNALEDDTNGIFSVRESAAAQNVIWGSREPLSLETVYAEEICVAPASHR